MQIPQMNPQVIQQIKSMMSQIRMARDPQYALSQMLVSNPRLKSALELIKNAGDSKTAFLNYAKQLGVDPQQVINALQE